MRPKPVLFLTISNGSHVNATHSVKITRNQQAILQATKTLQLTLISKCFRTHWQRSTSVFYY